MNEQEYNAMRQKLAAAGYKGFGFNEIFTPTMEMILGQVSEMVKDLHGGEEISDRIQAYRMDQVSEFLQRSYPGIKTSEAVLLFATALMELTPKLVFQSTGNNLGVKNN